MSKILNFYLSIGLFALSVSFSSFTNDQSNLIKKNYENFETTYDEGQSITFSMAPIKAGTDLIGTTFIPFVSRPDGTLIKGAPVSVLDEGIINFPTIQVINPQFGVYQFRLQIINGTGMPIYFEKPFIDSVFASRNDETTLLSPLEFNMAIVPRAQGISESIFEYDVEK